MTYLPDRADELPCVADVSRRLAVRAVTGKYVPSAFDVLIEQHSGKVFQRARAEAQEMCGACPIRDQCLVENRHEEWVQALIGVRVRKAPVERESCGTTAGYTLHMRAKEKACDPCKAANAEKGRRLAARLRRAAEPPSKTTVNTAARIENLRDLVATGASLDEACSRLGITAKALDKWCRAHKCQDLWRALKPPQPEALVKVRRRGAA